MKKKTYLFDTNVVIYLDEQYTNILKLIDDSIFFDYKIDNGVALELMNSGSHKPIDNLGDILSNHIIENNWYKSNMKKENRLLVSVDEYIIGNKISNIDYGLLMICLNTDYILVTRDMKLLKNAKQIL